jgi:hypothetical protein
MGGNQCRMIDPCMLICWPCVRDNVGGSCGGASDVTDIIPIYLQYFPGYYALQN